MRRTIVLQYQHHDVKTSQHNEALLRFNNKTVTSPCFVSVSRSNNHPSTVQLNVRRYSTSYRNITLFQSHGELHMGPCQFKHHLHQVLGRNPTTLNIYKLFLHIRGILSQISHQNVFYRNMPPYLLYQVFTEDWRSKTKVTQKGTV